MEIKWINTSSVRTNQKTAVAVTVNKNGNGKAIALIVIYHELMKKIRAFAGDRAAIGWNETHIAIKRVTEGGYAMSASGSTGKGREKKIGKPVTVHIKMINRFPFPIKQRVEFDMDEIEISSDGVVLLPILDKLTKES